MSARVPRIHPALAAAAALYLATRGLVLYTAFDRVALPQFELFSMGTMARDLLGPASDVPLVIYYDNALGQFLMAVLSAASFRLFGASYLALKLVSFVVLFPGLFLVWSFLRRHFGTLAAAVGAFLFALPPTTMFEYSLIVVGNHGENVTFTMLAVLAFFRVHSSTHRTAALFLAGLAGGVALAIFLGALVPVALLFATHVGLVGWRRGLREVPVATAGLLLGLVPLLLANALAGGQRGWAFLAAKFGESDAGFDAGLFAQRVGDFFALHLPRAGQFPDWLGLPGAVPGTVFLAAFVAAYALSLPGAVRSVAELVRGGLGGGALAAARDEAGGALPRAVLPLLILYLPLTAIAFGFSNLRMGDHAGSAGYRYFLPHFLFAILLIAIAAGRRSGTLRLGLLVAAFAPGLFSLDLIDPSFSRPNLGAHYAGYNMKQNARVLLMPKNGLTVPEIVRLAESYPPIFRARVYYGLGFYEPFGREPIGRHAEDTILSELFAAYPEERRPDLGRGAGTLLWSTDERPVPAEAWTLLARWHAEGDPSAGWAAEGLCSKWGPLREGELAGHLQLNLGAVSRSHADQDLPLAAAVARGFGLDCGRLLRRGIRSEIEAVDAARKRIPAEVSRDFYFGLGMGLADGGEEPAIPGRSVEWVPKGRGTAVVNGFLSRLAEIYGPGAAPGVLGGIEMPLGW